MGIVNLQLAIGKSLKRRERTGYGLLFKVRGLVGRIVQVDSAFEC
jgi:hypothetical protein